MTTTIYYIISAIILLCIAYQDLKHREVSWILFPALAICGFMISFNESKSISSTLHDLLLNVVFISCQLIFLFIYHSLKNRRKSISSMIGLGDILFIGSVLFFFSIVSFIVFYLSSLIFSLIIFLLFIQTNKLKKHHDTIPLAGLQSVFLVLTIAFQNFSDIHLVTSYLVGTFAAF